MRTLQEAIIANDTDKPFDRKEFDKLFARYDEYIVGSPCYLCPNITKAYLEDPDIKFIFTERTPESWAKSITGSLGAYHAKLAKPPLSVARYLDSFICMESVKTLSPPERLLILNLEKGFGWEEICTFLKQDVPDEPYPRINAIVDFHVAAEMVVSPAIEKTIRILTSSAVAVTAIGVWYWQRRR
ncbi:hypothetical protein LZ31DRAFT_634888 [Colletotrichum somersetense]|nr:hypothetical protein LZ31DRAFT_634888 [Colletotrichum somersetense]